LLLLIVASAFPVIKGQLQSAKPHGHFLSLRLSNGNFIYDGLFLLDTGCTAVDLVVTPQIAAALNLTVTETKNIATGGGNVVFGITKVPVTVILLVDPLNSRQANTDIVILDGPKAIIGKKLLEKLNIVLSDDTMINLSPMTDPDDEYL
jgi:predicted aspartyl protease